MLGRPEKKKRRGGKGERKGERKRKRMGGREGGERANIYIFSTPQLSGKFTCYRRKNVYRGPDALI